MKKIANIVTRSKKNVFGDIFNVVDSFGKTLDGIPTLVIGMDIAKENISGFNILAKRYGDIWWTFSKTERRCEYEDDIVEFYKYAVLHEMDKVRYVYIDPINYSLDRIKKAIGFLRGGTRKYVFLTRNSNFMFVYSEKYNAVFGISLELCEYLGVDRHKVYRLVRNSEYIHDTSFIDSDLRKVIGNNTHYILPLYTYFK